MKLLLFTTILEAVSSAMSENWFAFLLTVDKVYVYLFLALTTLCIVLLPIVCVLYYYNRLQKHELSIIKSKMELAFSAAKIIPWEFDTKTQMFYSPNTKAFKYKGLSLNELLSYTAESDAEILSNNIMLLSGKQKERINLQIRITFPGSKLRWYALHGIFYKKNKANNAFHIVGISRDVTDIKTSDELIRLQNKAEEAHRLKMAFLGNISHEIRTPLNAIVGFSGLLVDTEDKDERIQYKKIIETNNRLLLKLINDILDLSKIEAKTLDLHYALVEIAPLFQQLYEEFRIKIPKEVTFIYERQEVSHTIFTDKSRVKQILSNLLDNACKFTHQGYIKMGYTCSPEGIRFYVKDSGKGIAPQYQTNIFQHFSQVDEFSQGTGLGLTLCKLLIDALKGEIGVESKPGEGSEFWFTLPGSYNELPLLHQKNGSSGKYRVEG